MKGDNMKIKTKVEYFLCDEDYKRIKAAVKAQNRTIKSVYEELGINKEEFYNQIRGRKPLQWELYKFISELDVQLIFEGMC